MSTSKAPEIKMSASPSGTPCLTSTFAYRGAKNPKKVRGCMTCLSAVAGMCAAAPPHEAIQESCGACMAAQRGACGTHGIGVVKAMDTYAHGLSDDQKAVFARARQLVDEELAAASEQAVVEVEVGGTTGAHIDGAGSATGAPARTFIVSVKVFEPIS